MSIQSVEVTLPFAGITQAQATIITGTPGITQITSTTAPSDTSVIWIDPETGIQSIYSGGGWVTQLIRTSADGAYTDENGNPYFSPTGTFYIAP